VTSNTGYHSGRGSQRSINCGLPTSLALRLRLPPENTASACPSHTQPGVLSACNRCHVCVYMHTEDTKSRFILYYQRQQATGHRPLRLEHKGRRDMEAIMCLTDIPQRGELVFRNPSPPINHSNLSVGSRYSLRIYMLKTKCKIRLSRSPGV
jgi:hypothetical protein